jgi:hypothetical protein
MGGLTACWVVLLLVLRNSPEVIKSLFTESYFLRLLTVGFIVIATTLLGLVGKLTPELSTIFAGIAGFVLGGVEKKPSGKSLLGTAKT